MATRLIQILSFVDVPPATSVPLPHQINVNDVPMAPDFVALDAGGFSISVNELEVTVTNTSGALASVNVWLELKHTIARVFGAAQTTTLVPRPFVAAAGGGGGGDTLWESSPADPNHPENAVISNVSPVGPSPSIVRVGPDPAGFFDAQMGVIFPGNNPLTTNQAFVVQGISGGGIDGGFNVGLISPTLLGAVARALLFGDNTNQTFGGWTVPQLNFIVPGTYDDMAVSSSLVQAEAGGIITIRGWLPSGDLANMQCPFVFFFNAGTANVVFADNQLTSDPSARFALSTATMTIGPKSGAIFYKVNAPAGYAGGGTRWACIARGP